MQKSTLLIVCLIAVNVSFAQYQKTIVEGCSWNVYYFFESAQNTEYRVEEETMINDTSYHRISSWWFNPDDSVFVESGTWGYLREDTTSKRIYRHNLNAADDLLIDYSLNVGDTFKVGSIYNWIVDSITNNLNTYSDAVGHVNIDMPERKVFYLGPSILIEGIGLFNGPFNFFEHNSTLICHFDSMGHKDFYTLVDSTFGDPFNFNSTCLGATSIGIQEIHNQEIKIFPNPTSSQISIEMNSFEKVEIFSLSGVLVKISSQNTIDLSNLSKGVYFLKLTSGNKTNMEKIIKI